MLNISNAIQWDRILDAIEDSAAASTLARLIDPALLAWEQSAGLSDATRTVIFGESSTPYKSILLSYFDKMKSLAREEQSNAPGEYEESAPVDNSQQRGASNAAPVSDVFSHGKKLLQNTAALINKFPAILPGDSMSPRERVERHIRFGNPDRVAVAPLLGFHTARAGGITVREFMTDGRKAAAAARRTWDLYGGFDMMPFNFAMAYLFPLIPESHSRFCSLWSIPENDELPKMLEQSLLSDYGELRRKGCSLVFRTEGGRLLHEFRRMLPEAAAFAADNALNFPGMNQYHPYAAGVINHPADLISMWFGFENFMMDCACDPQKIREACERLAPGLVELGEFSARLIGATHVLYGVSRVAGSWISRKMFDSLFAHTFRSQVWQAHDDGFTLGYHLDNDYTPMLDFFLELPRHSGFMHLDQTDIFKAKEILHGHLCLMGNLHPGLMAAGTPAQVAAQAERLVKEVGAGGGFILATACEVPVDTPVENLKVLKETVDRFGWY